MSKTPLKKIIKTKLKSNRELSPLELQRENIKYEVAEELGLIDKVKECGWSGLTAEETGRIGGIMAKKKKELNIPKNKDIVESLNK